MERLLDSDEVADLLGLTRRRVGDLVRSRDPAFRLPAFKLGTRLRFRPSEIEAYIAARRVQPGAVLDALVGRRRKKVA